MKRFGGIQDAAKEIAFFTLSLAFAFALFMGAVIVQSEFLEGTRTQVPENIAISRSDFLDKSGDPQKKNGSITANEFWVDSIDWYATRFPPIKIHRATVGGNGGSQTVTVYCEKGYKLVSCGGAMTPEGLEEVGGTGCPNDNCGFIGVIPIDIGGNRSETRVAVGCKATVDTEDSMQTPTVDAYCMRANP